MSRHLAVLTAVLLVAGLSIFAYKTWLLDVPVTAAPSGDHWSVEARVSFLARGGPVKVSLALPLGASNLRPFDEGFSSQGFGLTTEQAGNQRTAVWAVRNAKGRRNLFYRGRFIARGSAARAASGLGTAAAAAPEAVKSTYQGSRLQAAQSLLAQVRERSADLPTMGRLLLKTLRNPTPDENVALLLGSRRNQLQRVSVAVNVLSLAGIPARAMHGIRLEEQQRNAPVITWLEAWNGQAWIAFAPLLAEGAEAENLLPWWSGPDPPAKLQGGRRLELTLSVARAEEVGFPQSTDLSQRGSPWLRFSTLTLPTQTQLVYRVVLMLPLGALLVVLIRNVIGFKTLGTFMPVLIALAFRETELVRGVMLFTLVVLAGLGVRAYLEQLKLLLVPRLATVLTVVVLLMAGLSILSHQLELEAGLSVALFPIVILTMTIERITVVWEERGAGEAFTQGVGSLGAAIAAYLVMNIESLQYLIFVFPELLLVVAAILLPLGRYSGYRLTELPRFRVLAKKEG